MPINKFMMEKSKAELEYGFRLYQGGMVPSNTLRIVQIEGIDTEVNQSIQKRNDS